MMLYSAFACAISNEAILWRFSFLNLASPRKRKFYFNQLIKEERKKSYTFTRKNIINIEIFPKNLQ